MYYVDGPISASANLNSFVQSLEERVRELEAQQAVPTPQAIRYVADKASDTHLTDGVAGLHQTTNDSAMGEPSLAQSGSSPARSREEQHANAERTPTRIMPEASVNVEGPQQRTQETLAENLRNVSLAAVAEPYLGSISGLTFAKLTQAVLRRLSPDGRDFVFSPQLGGNAGPIEGATNLHLDFMNNIYFDFDQAIDFNLLMGEGALPAIDTELQNSINALPDRNEVLRLATFYFDHSHTLYPILHQQEVMSDLNTILLDPDHPTVQSPPCLFRIWMVLAIGSTTHSSITLAEESVSRLYYEKAMTYFESSMDHGDIVSVRRTVVKLSDRSHQTGRPRSHNAPGIIFFL